MVSLAILLGLPRDHQRRSVYERQVVFRMNLHQRDASCVFVGRQVHRGVKSLRNGCTFGRPLAVVTKFTSTTDGSVHGKYQSLFVFYVKMIGNGNPIKVAIGHYGWTRAWTLKTTFG